MEHAFSTIITASSIGKNCGINQQVTTRFKNLKSPVTVNDVTIGYGAKVSGDVIVGNNVTIGANAVVIKDVPDNCVVGGVPAIIIGRTSTVN